MVSKAVYVFAADHGITAEGVSAYPSAVTQQMVLNFLSGGAAINVLARLNQVQVNVVDVGVDADLSGHLELLQHKVRRGSRNMLQEAAMSEDELAAALAVGFDLADAAFAQGHGLIAVGEMGIGNTTAASVMTVALTNMPAALATGKRYRPRRRSVCAQMQCGGCCGAPPLCCAGYTQRDTALRRGAGDCGHDGDDPGRCAAPDCHRD